jgi:hypothetical protein
MKNLINDNYNEMNIDLYEQKMLEKKIFYLEIECYIDNEVCERLWKQNKLKIK